MKKYLLILFVIIPFITNGQIGVEYVNQGGLFIGNYSPKCDSVASSATPTINTDVTAMFLITALATDITSMTTNLSGNPYDGKKLLIRIYSAAAQNITWGAKYANGIVALPTITIAGKTMLVGLIYNSTSHLWMCQAAGSNL